MILSRRDRFTERLALVVTLAAVAALSFTRLQEADLGFLVATGRAIRALGHIPATNVLSFTEPDHPWILHEWVPSLVFEALWRNLGPNGVLAFKTAMVMAAWGCVFATARRLGASPLLAGFCTTLGAGAAAIRFAERPQIFSQLAFTVVSLLLVMASEETPPPANAAAAPRLSRRAKLLLAVFGVLLVASHVHAGVLTSYTLVATVAFGVAVEPLRARALADEIRGPHGLLPALRLLAVPVTALAAALATLALYHPHWLRVLWVPIQLGRDPFLRDHVSEYQSPLKLPFHLLDAYWLLFYAMAVVLALRVRRMPATQLVPLVAFAFLAMRFVRALDSFAAIAAPVLAVSLQGLASRVRPRVTEAVSGGLLAASAIAFPLDHWTVMPPGPGLSETTWPADMFDFISSEHLAGPAYVSDGWAGPFLAMYYPRERAFFDARFEAYSHAFVSDVYQRIRYGEPGWEELLDRYGVEYLVLKYTSPREQDKQHGRDNVRQLLARSPRWTLVAFGDYGELFVRRYGKNAAHAERFSLEGLDPDQGTFLVPPAKLIPALLALVTRGFDDNRVITFTAMALIKAGDRDTAQKLLDKAAELHGRDPQTDDVRALLEKR